MRRVLSRAAAGVALLVVLGGSGAAVRAGPTLEPLAIHTTETVHRFQVEVPATAEARRQGLMYRRTLSSDRGMLFLHDADTEIVMWMKNTLIPLDMIFIDSRGIVRSVARETTPLSERPIVSPGGVRAVLEINGGLAEKLGIGPGACVEFRAFSCGAVE